MGLFHREHVKEPVDDIEERLESALRLQREATQTLQILLEDVRAFRPQQLERGSSGEPAERAPDGWTEAG